jgi:hypothetical protein
MEFPIKCRKANDSCRVRRGQDFLKSPLPRQVRNFQPNVDGRGKLSRLHSGRACRRRNLANAFLGEVLALVEAVEAYEDFDRLKVAAEGTLKSLADFQVFAPPRFVVYENSVGHLGIFNSPLQHGVILFYTRLQRLVDYLNALPSFATSPETSKQCARAALTEISGTIVLGDELVRSLRRFVIPRPAPTLGADAFPRRSQ